MKTCAVEEWSRQLGAFVSRADANVTCSYMPYAFHSTNTARNIWGGVLGREARCFCLVIPTALSSGAYCMQLCMQSVRCAHCESHSLWRGSLGRKGWSHINAGFAQARSLFSVH